MRRLLAALIAAALIVPSPSLAAEIELNLQGSGPTALTNATAQTGAVNVSVPLSVPGIEPAASLSPSAIVTASAQLPQAQARASVQTLAQAVAKPEQAAPALNASFDHSKFSASASDAVLAPAPSSVGTRLARWTARQGARATGAMATLMLMATASPAQAWVDGNPNDYRQLAQHAVQPVVQAAPAASHSPAWLGWAIVAGFVAAVGGMVAFLRWRDNKQDAAREAARTAPLGSGYEPGTSFGGNSYWGGGSKEAKKKAEEEKKFPGGRDAAGQPIMFTSIAGQDDAVAELQKVLHFIKNREKYAALNPRVEGQKGILFYGPPGTGKTFLAQALANESGMHFVHMNGSDFINKFVGTGPAAVRELFKEAADKGGPTIVFIDEIEAILKKRTGNDNNKEEDKTVNAVLAELDGFKKNPNIIVIGATNLPEQIDPAALRGGRFALQIPVGLPDVNGRKDIFDKYLAGMKLADGVDAMALAKQTPGVSGADIKYIVNRASIDAGYAEEKTVGMNRFLEAVDERAAGLKRKIVLTAEEKKVLAYHEGGHALLSHVLPDADPVRKVTSIGAGLGALGYMQSMPEEERHMYSREWLVAKMAVAFGGRVGEEIATGRKYTGASNDIQQASSIARAMVTEYGMSDLVGTIAFDPLFAQGKAGTARSEWMNRQIDKEVKRLVDEAMALARTTIEAHRAELDALAKELQEKETLRGPDLERLIPTAKKPVQN